MEFKITQHLGAISPYSKILRNPATPASHKIDSAVYLFRHGIIHVNGHDFNDGIVPFLQKLRRLQQANCLPSQGRLGFLSTYTSWITKADIGMISSSGLSQSHELGRAFRDRYSAWRKQEMPDSMARMLVWSDAAARCVQSARAFAEGFASEPSIDLHGNVDHPSSTLCPTAAETIVIDGSLSKDPCDNLCSHRRFPEIDQKAGQDQADAFLSVYTRSTIERLQPLRHDDFELEPKDIYAMQLLCCYDLTAGKESPFSVLFDQSDWLGFEYMRDIKYHYSEGHGAVHPGIYATPWLDAAVKLLQKLLLNESPKESLPLRIGFTHREEILYLAVLLGVARWGPEAPRTDRIDESRRWRVSSLAPYLGHIGLELFRTVENVPRMRVIINGEVVSAFQERFRQDGDGGYDIAEVEHWIQRRVEEWDKLKGGRITFLDR